MTVHTVDGSRLPLILSAEDDYVAASPRQGREGQVILF